MNQERLFKLAVRAGFLVAAHAQGGHYRAGKANETAGVLERLIRELARNIPPEAAGRPVEAFEFAPRVKAAKQGNPP
jgi:hypothetical protein